MVYRVWKLVAVTKTIIATVIKIVIITMWKKSNLYLKFE